MRRNPTLAGLLDDLGAIAILVAAGILVGLALPSRPIAGQADDGPRQTPDGHFEVVDVWVDSGDRPLAAYQIELVEPTGQVEIAGVEGGAARAFEEPPFYDPKALRNHRIVLAAFSTETELPSGRTRVARLHVWTRSDAAADFTARLVTAATRDGEKIQATVTAGTENAKDE